MEIRCQSTWAICAATVLLGCSPQSEDAVMMEEPMMDAEVAIEAAPVGEPTAIVEEVPSPQPRVARPRAGVVTAGDIDDGLNLAAFTRYQHKAAKTLRLPRVPMENPVLAQLRGPSGRPASGARITLRAPGAPDPFYDGYSGVDGMVTIFPASFEEARLGKVEMRVFPDNAGAPVSTTLDTGGRRTLVTLPFDNAWSPDFLDLVFVVDTTGSMGDELAWLAKELRQITQRAKKAAPGVDIRFGLVVYKAPADPYVVKSYGFTRNVNTFTRWVKSERSSGGAGGPEVVADALKAAVAMDWRRGKGERLLFQIGDEPPTPVKTKTYYQTAKTAAAKGIQVFGLAASGVEAHLEFLMRQGAALTGGRYLFLTDDSGVGFAHGEPAISCYRVTRLNDLMVRVLRSELSGRRVEAAPSDVIREVGSYQAGVCRN